MKMKRFLSLFLIVCMLIQVLPVFASDDEQGEIVNSAGMQYIINEEFGLNDLGGFSKNLTALGTVDTVEIEEESENYAFVFTSRAGYWEDSEYAILNIDGADFVEGADLVLKTRIKLEGAKTSTRAMFKYNKDTSDTTEVDDYTGLAFMMSASGLVGWSPNASGVLGIRPITTTSTSLVDTWVNAEIRFADSENATMVLTDDNGGTTGEIPFYPSTDMTNGIENIFLRCHSEDKIYVDYIQIYYEYETVMNVDSRFSVNEPITVTFDTNIGNEAFKDAVCIYDDAGNLVTTQNTIDETNKIVTLTPEDSLNDGTTYTVRVDRTLLPGNYVIDETEKAFLVSDYILNEYFGANDLGGFTKNSTAAGSVDSVKIDEDTENYAFVFTSKAGYWEDSEYAILNIDGADFVEGADLVLKTRIKLEGAKTSTRAMFKYNKDTSDTTEVDDYTGLAFMMSASGLVGWAPNANGVLGVKTLTTSLNLVDTWVDAEIRFSDSENATIIITNEDGESTGEMPFYPSADMTNGIENIFLRGHSEDKIYVDYIQIYYEYEIVMNVDSRYGLKEPVTVTFDTAEGNAAFKEAVAIYDKAGNKVATQNSIDETNKIVTLTPVNSFVDGAMYTVRVDKTNIPVNYKIAITEKQFLASDFDYILNEHFGANDLGGFTKNSTAAGSIDAVKIDEDTENYAFVFTSAAGYWEDSEYAILNVDGADFVEDKDLIIKTRIKLEGAKTSTRAMFKYNKDTSDTTEVDDYTGLAFMMSASGLAGWSPNANGVLGVKTLTTSLNLVNTWVDAEIRFSDSENATMIITNENGESTGVIPMHYSSDITTGIENIFLRGHSEDKIYLDYFQIFYGYETEMIVNGKYRSDEPVTVTFDTKEGNETFKDAVAIYDSMGNKVATQNTIDETNKIVSLMPVTPLTNEASYTVRLDKTAIPSNYIVDENVKQFLISDFDYILNEQFGLNDLGGFTKNSASAGTLGVVEIPGEANNYAVEFSSGAGYWEDAEYAILNIDGADFVEGKELVINTRIKLVGSGVENRAPRAVFKYNKEASDTTEASDNTNLFFIMSGSGLAGWDYSDEGILGTRTLPTTSTNLVNTWVNAEIRIADSENAIMVITDENGGTTGVIPMYYSSDITTGIENIFVRSHKEDKVYIDYITIRQVDKINVQTKASAQLKVNGTASTVVTAGDSVVPVFTLQGNPGTRFTVISAMYVDGVLDSTHIETLTAQNVDEFTYTESTGYTVPQTGKVEVKAFVWNALYGLKPISTVAKATSD